MYLNYLQISKYIQHLNTKMTILKAFTHALRVKRVPILSSNPNGHVSQ